MTLDSEPSWGDLADQWLKKQQSSGGDIQKTEISTERVVYREWIESERGWGRRPDGFSLHLTEEDCLLYIAEYIASMSKKEVLDEYSFPQNRSETRPVLPSLYQQLLKAKEKGQYGLRFYQPFEKINNP